MIKEYHKLVRDRMREIIVKEGKEVPWFRVLSKKEFFREAKKKIKEEAQELLAAHGRKAVFDELIDIQQLIDALISELNLTRLEFWTLQRKKYKERGGFEKKIFLDKTEQIKLPPHL